jgi:23S rRNA-/tRNA-specific pseudouridylate synthase
MAVIPEGSSAKSRPAQTRVQVQTLYSQYSLVACRPVTGRTHQIRVHLAFAGFPLAGDRIYGRRKDKLSLDRHFLHAAGLTFKRPSDGTTLDFQIPLPADLQAVLDRLQE